MPIDFTPTLAQEELRRNARGFAETVLAPVADEIQSITDPVQSFTHTRAAYREMAKAGFTKSYIPAADGGLGFGMIDFALAAEELTRVDVNVPSTLLATGLGLQPVIQFGTPEQRKRFLTPFVEDGDGERLASFAFTEVGGGANYDSDDPACGVATLARREGDVWVVSGEKHYTTNGWGWDGKGAHLFTVVCRTDAKKGARDALAVLAVPGDAPGVRVVEAYDKLGHRGVVTPRVHFEAVRVPAANLIGKPGDGLAIVSRSFSWTAALIGAACVGVMRRAFEIALDFARTERRLGAEPVIAHQAVGFLLADVKMRIEAARYLTWKACHAFETTGDQELAIETKVYCSELAVQVVYDAMRVVGVESYTKRTPLERLLRDAIVFPLYDGGNIGVRRRQLHAMLREPSFDSMRAAENRGR